MISAFSTPRPRNPQDKTKSDFLDRYFHISLRSKSFGSNLIGLFRIGATGGVTGLTSERGKFSNDLSILVSFHDSIFACQSLMNLFFSEDTRTSIVFRPSNIVLQ